MAEENKKEEKQPEKPVEKPTDKPKKAPIVTVVLSQNIILAESVIPKKNKNEENLND